MTKDQLLALIQKYLDGTSDAREKQMLEAYLDNLSKQEDEGLQNLITESGLKEEILIRLDKRIQMDQMKGKSNLYLHLISNTRRYTALLFIVSGLIAAAFYYQTTYTKSNTQLLSSSPEERLFNHIQVIPENLSLQLSDGSFIDLKDLLTTTIVDPNYGLVAQINNEGKLDYSASNLKPRVKGIHSLYIPNGEIYSVILSDGTEVMLNSGTYFSYPIHLNNSHERLVSIEGEGYFTVSENKKIPFLCKSEDLITKVYGTKFNFSAYAGEDNEQVYLEEGSVSVKSSKNSNSSELMLEPGTVASFNIKSGELAKEFQDPKDYLGWIDGILFFKNEPLSEILKKLERKFGFQISNNNKDLNSIKFSGQFKTETLPQILDLLKRFEEFNYTIDESAKTLIIN